ncbi:MAG: hypothetical protein KatS3mg131_0676 [Candidatus Tectimicrobiota bacterium]|nr:MAG: hypothetical protein KatS3mg131_0676 [Candidatus Tectomicrobia bacterium]
MSAKRPTWRRLGTYVAPYRRRLAVAIVCGVLVSAVTSAAALLVKPLLDGIFVARDVRQLWLLPPLLMLLYGLRGLLHYGHVYLMRSIGQRVLRDMRQRLFAHLQRLPLAFFHHHPSGALVARFTHDVALLERAVSGAVNDLLRQGLTMLGLIGVAFYRDWLLASCALVVLPLGGGLTALLGRRLRRLSLMSQARMAELGALVQEVCAGIRIVKGFGRETYEEERFQQRNTAYYRISMRAVRTAELHAPLMEGLAALGVAAVILYGGHRVIAGQATPGTFFSFLAALFMLYEPLRKLSRVNATLQGSPGRGQPGLCPPRPGPRGGRRRREAGPAPHAPRAGFSRRFLSLPPGRAAGAAAHHLARARRRGGGPGGGQRRRQDLAGAADPPFL